jgi:dTDP-4-amino-4,6-dideoxygalactose transaminase
MNIQFVDLHAQYLSIKKPIDDAIADVIANSAYIRGSHVERFEKAWAGTVGTQHCVSCANGTDALYVAMRALGIRAGDEVITTAHSWISTSETITQAGGRVVFCDTEPGSFTIDPKLIEAKITSRTVGIIPVHLYGQPCDMGPIMETARRNGLWVIEDCAQAHLAKFNGRSVGTFGDVATFSFYPGKNLGAYGDAGCLVTNNAKLAEWSATYSRHGGKGEHVMEGINSRLDGIQAAVLNVKLPHLLEWTALRRRVAARYDEILTDLGEVETPFVAPGRYHVYHLYVLKTDARDDLRAHLAKDGIATVLNYPKALPYYPAYSYLGHTPEDFPEAYANQSRILSLPIYPEMTDEMIDHVGTSITRFFRGRSSKPERLITIQQMECSIPPARSNS